MDPCCSHTSHIILVHIWCRVCVVHICMVCVPILPSSPVGCSCLSHAPTFLLWLPAVASCGSALSLPLAFSSLSQLRKSCKSWNKINTISLLTSLHDCIYNEGRLLTLVSKPVVSGSESLLNTDPCSLHPATLAFLSFEHPRLIFTSRPLHLLILWSSQESISMSQLSCHLLREAS